VQYRVVGVLSWIWALAGKRLGSELSEQPNKDEPVRPTRSNLSRVGGGVQHSIIDGVPPSAASVLGEKGSSSYSGALWIAQRTGSSLGLGALPDARFRTLATEEVFPCGAT